MIVGTAGHIDHGKTTLVRALTGVDTDRLPEEKQRGISIELGYAFLDLSPEGSGQSTARIGFIDVPGHERLVHTMLAGATGIHHALLLVAADDGVMPQTREHLAVLALLGINQGAVVVTKCDRADVARVQAVAAEAAALLAPTPLAGAPVFTVAATTGEGLPALREHLASAAQAHQQVADEGACFRLAIDRAFSLDGVGTVVTGTVHAGRVALGDELCLVPGSRRARVRSLHAQNRAVQEAGAGPRCAVGRARLVQALVPRGPWLVAPAAALATDRLDASLSLWHVESKPLRSGTPVHVHLGAAAVQGTLAVLDGLALLPGESGRVQLLLRQPVGAWWGDRVVLRDASASRTLAGGRVLDPFAPTRYRRTPQRLAELQALAAPDPAQRLAGLVAVAPQGVDLRRWCAAQGRRLPEAQARESASVGSTASSPTALASIVHGSAPPSFMPPAVLRHTDAQHDMALGPAQTAAAESRVLETLAAYHERQPEEAGPDAARLRRLALPRLPEPLWRALLARLQREGRLQARGAFVHLPAHAVQLSATEERIAQKVAPRLADAGYEGAWVRDLARDAGEAEALLRVTLARLAQRGELHQVVKDLYYPPATMQRLAAIARQVGEAHGEEVTAARFRDATGLGRKRAIQILEHFDRIGLLRRVGDLHRLRHDTALFVAEAA